MLAATVRVTRDLDLAEECVQDAFATALTEWADGMPARPGAWLTTVSRRRALDALRRQSTLRSKLPLLVEPEVEPGPDASDSYPDDRLRLLFTCCHPALSLDAQVALTLRLLCGLSTAEVARAFLVTESTMAARITRAKKKISQARIPYRIPEVDELPERVEAVLAVVHLLFTTGHTAPGGERLVRQELVARARDLATMLHELLPSAEVAGLLALILLLDARRATRVGDDGHLLLLEEQDRTAWDRADIERGLALVRAALLGGPPGRYALQAAIAAVHADALSWEDTDWREIVALYGLLQARWPSPVVALNRAVAVGFSQGPQRGLMLLDELAEQADLRGYPYLPAARADFLRKLGRHDEARRAYLDALDLTQNTVERAFLQGRVDQLSR